ncbi:HDIG domain-containing metalloprotein [Desulfurivibrio alkaliphilus]|uniref:Metal dependent phosphohydrolase n=1 Tax=Desulfurivibrio alkaliphilus (strain DSM 19089 / UNIQEM U267 / AHT2) TaxID=589865 RepID=D6Z505_DESAT|nr:HDIG domain-containing metalloprotein [Desulfurivibrio alkaliphilus]ADH86630.1 metal dependent phosphohydrolase [Desulfurivibrio alkaliphilus AHT 2]
MPPTEKHFITSLRRTGHDYADLHRWIDDPEHKNQRHDFTRIPDFAPQMVDRFGEEGMREYVEHLREDMEKKFAKINQQYQDGMREAREYFGITARMQADAGDYQLDPKDIDLLRQAGMNEPDLEHSLKVAAKALAIARRTGAELDLALVGRGALFHDLGKVKTHWISHGRVGAELGAELGLPPEINAIMEKHIRGGLTEAEAVELELPVKDYTLKRLEERIVIYADRLVDIIHDGIVALSDEGEAEQRFEEILKEYPKYGKNAATLARYLNYHREIQGLIAKEGVNR